MNNFNFLHLVDVIGRYDMVKHSSYIGTYNDDGDENWNEKVDKYVYESNQGNNNKLVIIEYTDIDCDSDPVYVINRLMQIPYEYVAGTLNNLKNVTVVISAVPDTTSDFVIIYDDVDCNNVENYIENCKSINGANHYKYTEIMHHERIKVEGI